MNWPVPLGICFNALCESETLACFFGNQPQKETQKTPGRIPGSRTALKQTTEGAAWKRISCTDLQEQLTKQATG